MRFASLQSGSSGNALYVEADGVNILIDAGLSAKQLRQRLAEVGATPENLDALIITHEHSDHSCGIGVIARQFNIPVYISAPTLRACPTRLNLAALPNIVTFKTGQSFVIEGVTVETIRTPHDAVDGSIFRISTAGTSLGIATDVGHVFRDLMNLGDSVDALYIESNYDVDMLRYGPYTPHLKRRIAGPGGHISNLEAAEAVGALRNDRLQWVCLGHLSAQNNSAAVTLSTHLDVHGGFVPLTIAPRYTASPWHEIAKSELPDPVATKEHKPRLLTMAEMFFDF